MPRSARRRSVRPTRLRFDGAIAGVGTRSGHRFVVGSWHESPFGAFVDVMHERPDGWRRLIAPSDDVATFVSQTYAFDEVVIASCSADRAGEQLQVVAGDVVLDLVVGSRTGLGRLLRLVPRAIATAPAWCALIDPVARLARPGVRTRGSAGGGRREWYGATDQHRLASASGSVAGQDVGGLADVWPPVRFGFSSTPRQPGIVQVTTTIDLAGT